MLEILRRQKEFFDSGHTLSVGFRREQLRRLKQALNEYQGALLQALETDLGKCAFEGYETELGFLFEELDYALRHLRSWTRKHWVHTPLMHFPARSFRQAYPQGAVLILAPWNYPLQLSIGPLIPAIAAGNVCMIKPASQAPNTAALLQRMIEAYFDPAYITVLPPRQDYEMLLGAPFDHIFFTGSVKKGGMVYAAAAKHLTKVTLELGGKSPCIVDKSANLSVAARRIAWGKALNAGQTCVAPDYVLVHSSVKESLVQALKQSFIDFYGRDILTNPEYARIVNREHFERLRRSMQNVNILYGGQLDAVALKIMPTLVDSIPPGHPLLEEEIFGPVLPILSYDTLSEALEIVRKNPKPLALYLFSRDGQIKKRVLGGLSFGGGCIGDTVIHLANPRLPFGGVGPSGLGAYHGKDGFLAFSHTRALMKKSSLIDIPFRYPPYGDKLEQLKKLMK